MTAVPVGPPVTTTNGYGQKVTTTHLSDGTIQVDTQTGGDEGAHRPTTKTEIQIDPAWAAVFRKPEDQGKPLPAPYKPKSSDSTPPQTPTAPKQFTPEQLKNMGALGIIVANETGDGSQPQQRGLDPRPSSITNADVATNPLLTVLQAEEIRAHPSAPGTSYTLSNGNKVTIDSAGNAVVEDQQHNRHAIAPEVPAQLRQWYGGDSKVQAVLDAAGEPQMVITDKNAHLVITRTQHGGDEGGNQPWTDNIVTDLSGNVIAHFVQDSAHGAGKRSDDGLWHYPVGNGDTVTINGKGDLIDPTGTKTSPYQAFYNNSTSSDLKAEKIPDLPGKFLVTLPDGRKIITDSKPGGLNPNDYHWVTNAPPPKRGFLDNLEEATIQSAPLLGGAVTEVAGAAYYAYLESMLGPTAATVARDAAIAAAARAAAARAAAAADATEGANGLGAQPSGTVPGSGKGSGRGLHEDEAPPVEGSGGNPNTNSGRGGTPNSGTLGEPNPPRGNRIPGAEETESSGNSGVGGDQGAPNAGGYQIPPGKQPGPEPGTWIDSRGYIHDETGYRGHIKSWGQTEPEPATPARPARPKQTPSGPIDWVKYVTNKGLGLAEDFINTFRPGELPDEVAAAINSTARATDTYVRPSLDNKRTKAFQPSWGARWQINRTLRERDEAMATRDGLFQQRDELAINEGGATPATTKEGNPKRLSKDEIEKAIKSLQDQGRQADADRLQGLDKQANLSINSVTQISSRLGVIGAKDYIQQIGGKVIYVGKDTSNRLDVAGIVNGKLVVIEAKGGDAGLNAAWVPVGKDVWRYDLQGTLPYLKYKAANDRDFLEALRAAGHPDLAAQIEAGDMGNVDYKLVTVDTHGNATVSGFDLNANPTVPNQALHYGENPPRKGTNPQNPNPPAPPAPSTANPISAALSALLPTVGLAPWLANLPHMLAPWTSSNDQPQAPSQDNLLGALQTITLPARVPILNNLSALPWPNALFGGDSGKTVDQSITVDLTLPQVDLRARAEARKVFGIAAHIR
ncbi:hypothetical protein ACFVUS_36115 [Nocardia sp. NPDC058058]|uniref:hypothetical protein n=1 Tax=Nocardia sp. NPDC058058 TaxID=3346317 RepID=UPI0036DD816A